jgi:hypothetical protein
LDVHVAQADQAKAPHHADLGWHGLLGFYGAVVDPEIPAVSLLVGGLAEVADDLKLGGLVFMACGVRVRV